MRARYDELERKLRFVGGEIGAFGLSIMRQASRAWHVGIVIVYLCRSEACEAVPAIGPRWVIM